MATVQVCKINRLINYLTPEQNTKKIIVRWSSTPKDLGLKWHFKRQFLLIKLV